MDSQTCKLANSQTYIRKLVNSQTRKLKARKLVNSRKPYIANSLESVTWVRFLAHYITLIPCSHTQLNQAPLLGSADTTRLHAFTFTESRYLPNAFPKPFRNKRLDFNLWHYLFKCCIAYIVS